MNGLGDVLPQELPAVHEHVWKLCKVQPAAAFGFGVKGAHTRVLGQCITCGQPETWLLAGEWTLADILHPAC